MKNELVAEILAGPAVTDWQKEELDRRLAEFESDPEAGSSLEEVFMRIRSAS